MTKQSIVIAYDDQAVLDLYGRILSTDETLADYEIVPICVSNETNHVDVAEQIRDVNPAVKLLGPSFTHGVKTEKRDGTPPTNYFPGDDKLPAAFYSGDNGDKKGLDVLAQLNQNSDEGIGRVILLDPDIRAGETYGPSWAVESFQVRARPIKDIVTTVKDQIDSYSQ